MKEIVFATNNKHKLEEIRSIVGSSIRIKSLEEIGFTGDIAETADTIEGNAIIKAEFIANRYKIDCFADDTGLEVSALNGAPGVYSARYAGENASYADNVTKLLQALEQAKDRSACFKTVVAYSADGKTVCFEGKICGQITLARKGTLGFGYDPVFLPDGYDLTFAEMDAVLKNSISHRALATKKLISFLQTSF